MQASLPDPSICSLSLSYVFIIQAGRMSSDVVDVGPRHGDGVGAQDHVRTLEQDRTPAPTTLRSPGLLQNDCSHFPTLFALLLFLSVCNDRSPWIQT